MTIVKPDEDLAVGLALGPVLAAETEITQHANRGFNPFFLGVTHDRIVVVLSVYLILFVALCDDKTA